jgi:putative sigma-54 modulation protein
MQINVTGRHLDVTDPIRQYVHDKLERIGRHLDNQFDVHVILSIEKLRQKAEATLHVIGGKLHAEADDEDMYAAVDALADKLDRQIRKYKEKLTDHHRTENSKRIGS